MSTDAHQETSDDILASIEALKHKLKKKGTPKLWKQLGSLYNDMEDYVPCIEAYRKGLALDPNDQAILYNMGMALYDTEDFNGAIIAFERVVELSPDDHGAIRWLGKTYFAADITEQALEQYETAVKLDDSVFYYWTELGEIYNFFGRSEDAIHAYKQANELEYNKDIVFNLGKLYLENTFTDHLYADFAVFYLENALTFDKADTEVQVLLKKAKKLVKTNTSE